MRATVAICLLLALLAGCAGDDDGGQTAAPTTEREAPAGDDVFARIPEVVDEVQPSVVSVLIDDGRGQGSGVVYREDGFIVTNFHVVAGANAIEVVLASGERVAARVAAADERTDVAVLRVDRDDLPAAEFAEALPEIGALAIAMGNPLGFENSVTAGIVSGVNRAIPSGGTTPALVDLIQTDAPISPGNSGGALVDAEGRVIGLNVAFIPPAERAVSLGFAIPSPTVVAVADQLIETGEVRHAFLGLRPRQVTPELNEAFGLGSDDGALALTVEGPAREAGLREGDVIVRMADREIATVEDLFSELRDHAPGDEVDVEVVREGKRRTFSVELGSR